MRYCPNPQCTYAQRHGEAAEYRDDAALCSDCGADLAGSRPAAGVASRDPGASSRTWARVAITCLAPAAAMWLCPRIPLPGLDQQRMDHVFAGLGKVTQMSPFSLALAPVVSAFFLVELLALLVPRWRRLRNGGPSARARLLAATWKLALALALVQAWSVVTLLEGMHALIAEERLGRVLVTFSLVGGTCLLVLFARWLDREGLGGGFSVLAIFGFWWSQVKSGPVGLVLLAGQLARPGPALALSVAACVATVLVLRRRSRDRQGGLVPIRLPACGFVPVPQATAALSFVAAGALLGWWPQPSEPIDASGFWSLVRIVLALVLAVFWSWVFNQPANVAVVENAAGSAAGGDGRLWARADLRFAMLWSAGYVFALSLADVLASGPLGAGQAISALFVAMATAVVMDVVAEARARLRLGEIEPVWPEHRLYAVDAALAALQRAGIPAFAQSAYHRALWHVFAPLIPIQILVPTARTDEARELLQARLSA